MNVSLLDYNENLDYKNYTWWLLTTYPSHGMILQDESFSSQESSINPLFRSSWEATLIPSFRRHRGTVTWHGSGTIYPAKILPWKINQVMYR